MCSFPLLFLFSIWSNCQFRSRNPLSRSTRRAATFLFWPRSLLRRSHTPGMEVAKLLPFHMWVEKTKKKYFLKNNLSAFSTTPKLIFFLQMPSFIFFSCTHIGLPHQWTTSFFFFFFQEPIPRNFLPLCPPPLSSSSRQWHCFFSCLFGDEVKRVGGFWSKSESISQLSDRFGLHTTKTTLLMFTFQENYIEVHALFFILASYMTFFPHILSRSVPVWTQLVLVLSYPSLGSSFARRLSGR